MHERDLETKLVVDDLKVADRIDLAFNMDDIIILKGACAPPTHSLSQSATQHTYTDTRTGHVEDGVTSRDV